ncbi:MAG TPA: CHAT domain-containing tetratricopeptide repeat protein [Bryobacteraceae bacterium]|nr:CHAT domain-containing tetratricopeptide repeat protein [Bryobacteraceae bacterium]
MTKWAQSFVVLALLLGGLPHSASSQDSQQAGWTTLDKQAEDFYSKGDLAQAIGAARRAVAVASDPKESARSLDRLGFFEYTSGNLKDGERDLRQALEIRKEKLGAESADYAESANDLALVCRDSGKLAEARALAEQAVSIRSREPGEHLRLAESLNTLGSTLGLMGDYDLAISKMEQALAIHESQPQPRELNEEYGTLCINLAGTYQRVGKYAKAEATFEKGLDVLRQKPGIHHPAYSASLVAYAYLQADLGHYAAAEKLYDEGGKLLREQLGEQHPFYAAFLNNRAALYTALGKLTVAEADYRKALDLKRKIYGPDALTIGASLRNLARLVYPRDPRESESLFREAVELYARNTKAPPFDFTSALLGLGEAQRDRGDLQSARETLERASVVALKGLGTKHPLYAAVLRDQAIVDQSAHDYARAEQRLSQAIGIVEQTHGENHPDLARYLELLARCYDEAGDYRAAEPLYRRSLDISDRTLSEMLTVGSENDKAAVFANLEDPIPALISFQRRAGDLAPSARTLAFEAVARRKGRVLDVVHNWGESLRENSDPAIRLRFSQREAMLECEASLTIALGYRDLKSAVVGTCALPGTELESRYERLLHDLRANWTETMGRQALEAVRVLQTKIDALEAELSREIPQFASVIRPATLAGIQSRLGPDEMLIEFVEYAEPGARSADRRYGAYLLGNAGGLEWADLGPAGTLDRAVQDLIASANDWSVALAHNEQRNAKSAAETARDALEALSRQLGPVAASIAEHKNVTRLRVAPDGMLNLIPFSALSDARGHFLIRHYAISYVAAGRDLAAGGLPGKGRGGAVIVAVSPGPKRSEPAVRVRSSFRADLLEGLADADMEARNVQKWMPRTQLLGEGEATEQRMKQLHRPALVHIVGHGVVRGNEDCGTEHARPGCELAGMDPAARVMNLSAIVLEEAYGRGGRSPQDGMLSALELQTLDLQGTEMLVLSQCRMADGVPSSGEGVYGMRRAAAIAGVKTFVAPLWRVADRTEQALMSRFYQELSAGRGRAESLRRAQLELLRNAPTGSFLEWAPVILSGDPGPLPPELFRGKRSLN